nr:uncharacterized protein LOC106690219 [Halyomorpha halys]XP_014291051.1 uncharacterized protein LOC106690219 [Halyomorpha halys]
MESLLNPRLEEIYTESEYGNARDLSTEKLLDILSGKESSYLDFRDIREVLLHRQLNGDPLLVKNSVANSIPVQFFGFLLLLLSIFAFFGWKLYQSLKDREKRREEKKKLKQKKKK